MGCWGLLGLLLMVSQWIIPENSLRLAQVRKCCRYLKGLGISVYPMEHPHTPMKISTIRCDPTIQRHVESPAPRAFMPRFCPRVMRSGKPHNMVTFHGNITDISWTYLGIGI